MDLSRRDTGLTELMDDPDCDPAALDRTYARFPVVNRVVAGWRGVYRSRIRPLLSADRETTLLDIGSGGGDVPLSLARWARRDGLRLSVTGIDPDPRAAAFA
ncbi:methyltransferase, partial [Clavibacter lycopersici]